MGNRSYTKKRYHGEQHWRHLKIKARQRDRQQAFDALFADLPLGKPARSYQQRRADQLAR